MAERILVVDDEAAVANVITECLRAAGFEPETTTDSVAAVELPRRVRTSFLRRSARLQSASPHTTSTALWRQPFAKKPVRVE